VAWSVIVIIFLAIIVYTRLHPMHCTDFGCYRS
jgi:hypothetical protein